MEGAFFCMDLRHAENEYGLILEYANINAVTRYGMRFSMIIANAIGAEIRRFEEREHDGGLARAVIAERDYSTDPADLWDAITNAERIPRWFLPVSGDLRLGGRYQLQGNAGGTITRCDPPEALDLTWEFGGGTSWVHVRLQPEGESVRLVLEHIAPVGVMEEHWASFGPAAVGTGWDLSLMGLGMYIETCLPVDTAAFATWAGSDEGKIFMRASAAAWAKAHIAAGEDADTAHGMAERTARFYTGEGGDGGGQDGDGQDGHGQDGDGQDGSGQNGSGA